MPRLDLERDFTDMVKPLQTLHECALPHCANPTVYRGQICASCEAAIMQERTLLRLKKEAKG